MGHFTAKKIITEQGPLEHLCVKRFRKKVKEFLATIINTKHFESDIQKSPARFSAIKVMWRIRSSKIYSIKIKNSPFKNRFRVKRQKLPIILFLACALVYNYYKKVKIWFSHNYHFQIAYFKNFCVNR